MSYTKPKRNQGKKQHLSHIEYRFNVVKRKAAKLFRFKHHKQSTEDREFEENIAYLIKHVEDYGFKWFPNHYIRDDIATLERLVESVE